MSRCADCGLSHYGRQCSTYYVGQVRITRLDRRSWLARCTFQRIGEQPCQMQARGERIVVEAFAESHAHEPSLTGSA